MLVEGRGHADYAANLAHGRSITLSTARVQRAPKRRTRAYLSPAHSRRRSRCICMPAMRRCIRERARSHPTRMCPAASKGYVFFLRFSPLIFRVPHPADDRTFIFFFPCPFLSFLFQLLERLRSVVRAWTCLSLTGQSFGTQQPWQPQQQAPPKPYKRKDYY